MEYKQKYLKYKEKYLALKQDIFTQSGGIKEKYLALKQGGKIKKEYLDLKGGTDLSKLNEDTLSKIFEFLTWKEIVRLGSTSKENLEVIRRYKFDFYDQRAMRVSIFQNFFPCAIGLNLSLVEDEDCREFTEGFTSRPFALEDRIFVPSVVRGQGIKRLKIVIGDITDAAFINFRGIHTLNINMCERVTGAGFVHLSGIHTLDMSDCLEITDAAFVYLRGIHTLNMSGCVQVTDAAFVNLRGIHTLNMSDCRQVTDAAFVNLKGIHTLNMSSERSRITDAAFVNLKGIYTLNMSRCSRITDAAFVHLRGIYNLRMNRCDNEGITDAIFDNLKSINTLHIFRCRPEIIEAAIARFRGLYASIIYEYDQDSEDRHNEIENNFGDSD